MLQFSFLLLSYTLGSIPFAKHVAGRYGIDIQKVGSGNMGFANTWRVLGLRRALPVLVGDVLKGFIPTALASLYLPPQQVLLVGAAAICGHIFPVWLRFRGGKGIATAAGVLLSIAPVYAAIGLIIYALAFAYFRVSAPASLTAAWTLPVCAVALSNDQLAFYMSLLALLVTWTHRQNIRTRGLHAARA